MNSNASRNDPQEQQLPAMGYPPMRRGGPPPPIGRTGSGGGACASGGDAVGGGPPPAMPPLPPPYLSNGPPPKYPPQYQHHQSYPPPHPPSSGHGHGHHVHHYRPQAAPESRYPPSSSRHEDYSRHGPPAVVPPGQGGPHAPPPPPVHYGGTYPPPAAGMGYHQPPPVAAHSRPPPPPDRSPGRPAAAPPPPPSSTSSSDSHSPRSSSEATPARPSAATTPASDGSSRPTRPPRRTQHPADGFGCKTITVSSRTSIDEPPVHAPPPSRATTPPAVVLRPAPTGGSQEVRFSPSGTGAFLPYRPSAARGGSAGDGHRSPMANVQASAAGTLWLTAPPPPPRPRADVVELNADDIRATELVDMSRDDDDDDVVVDVKSIEEHGRADDDDDDEKKEAADAAENAVKKEATPAMNEESDDTEDRELEELNRKQDAKGEGGGGGGTTGEPAKAGGGAESSDRGDRGKTKHGQDDVVEANRDDHSERGSKKSNHADDEAADVEESRDDSSEKEGPADGDEGAGRDREAAADTASGGSATGKAVAGVVPLGSDSMEISEDSRPGDKDAARDGAVENAARIEAPKQRRPRPTPITTTTTLKRPRSSPAVSRDDDDVVPVSVDDDTPKHINVGRPPSSNGGGAVFRYPSNDEGSNDKTNNDSNKWHGGQAKRSRLEDMSGASGGYEDSMVPTSGHDRGGYDKRNRGGDDYKGSGRDRERGGHPPPDMSMMKGGRSYSLKTYEEDRQDRPTTADTAAPASSHRGGAYSHRQPYEDSFYYGGHHPPAERGGGHRCNHPPPLSGGDPHPVVSKAPSRMSWTLDMANSQEYPEPASYLAASRSMSWEMPAGTLSAIGSTLSFGWNGTAAGGGGATSSGGGGATPSRSTPSRSTPRANPGAGGGKEPTDAMEIQPSKSLKPKREGTAAAKEGGGGAIEDDVEDDEIPPLLSTGSNLPPRKRALLAPRPSGPSNKLFEPPRPAGGRAGRSGEGKEGREVRHVEVRHARSSAAPRESREPATRYAPTTVHYPHERRQAPPPPVRSYSYDYQHQRYGDPHHYDARYKDYEPPRHPSSHHSRYIQSPGRYPSADPRSPHSRYPQSPGRYPEYESSHLKHPPTPGSAPWGSPPSSSTNHHHHRHRSDSYSHPDTPRTPGTPGTPGGRGGAQPNSRGAGGENGSPQLPQNGESRSFDSSMSKRSFRSLDDLEEPMQSLLYRPSFSWEQGLDGPPHPATPGGPPSSSHHPSSGHHHQSSHHFPGSHYHHASPPRAHGNYHHGSMPPPHYPGHPGHHPHSAGAPGTTMIQLRDQQKILKALTMRSEVRTIGNPSSSVGLILLLAMPQDRHCLSETLCIVRNNVEVFTATDADINAPAPGRKRPIQIGQVGLRCVYCRMCNTRDRVKRATCFPSSMKRIYRAVIDMKLDHFKNCPYVPPGLKARLDQLQAGSTRSTGMTVQYFVKSAKEMGMVDLEDGVTIDLKRVGKADQGHADFGIDKQGLGADSGGMVPYAHPPPRGHREHPHVTYPKQKGRLQHQQQPEDKYAPQLTTSHNAPPLLSSAPSWADQSHQGRPPPSPRQQLIHANEKRYSGKVLLTLPEDKNFLSPLRCFLREHVCAFTATARDIAVRTPTTFSVRVGQVGVGCIHCLSVPPKSRSNRAVCFPFTVARIYQSVADIQRFHLGECRMMPPEVRARFLQLQSESAKGSRGLATRTYWIDSAKKIGLADGPAGMYFYRDPSLPPPPPEEDAESLDLLAQVASNNDSIGRPLVTPEDRPTIAEFLYLVMEQLRPCRFTDADRNKRRSKNVGSIGVECRHCAGKIDGRKFFWSSVSAAESNFVSVHSHMLSCKYIPQGLKAELSRLKALRREQTSRLKTGSQKAFFTRVWARLHGTPVPETPTPIGTPKASPSNSNAAKGSHSKSAKRVHPSREVVFDTPPREEGDPILDLRGSNDSDEIRHLLESKSTLSSMPSVDDSLILKHGPTQEEIDDGSGSRSGSRSGSGGNGSDHDGSELKIGRSAESAGGASKSGSLTSVALNLSAVSVHCKEEQRENNLSHGDGSH